MNPPARGSGRAHGGADRPGPSETGGHSSGAPPKIALISLGCPKNLVDSEGMAAILEDIGFVAAREPHGADLLLINTCSFIQDATEESRETIAEALRLKREGAVKRVVAAGCLVQRLGARIADEFPDLDGAVGTASWSQIGEVCRRALSESGENVRLEAAGPGSLFPNRKRSSYGHFGYLKATEGCHRNCSYCVIPSLRGPLRSASPKDLLRESEALAAAGVVEQILVGEDIGAFGQGEVNAWSLARLLRELNRVPGVRWIRMLYVHPASVDERLIEAAEDCERVCPYIDIPIQHASNRILARMNRPTRRVDLERVLERLKRSPKGFALRTTVMVGFPGESEADFQDLTSFIRDWEFDHLGAFCYSRESGTPAAGYDGQVDEAAKAARRSEIMRIQSEISLRKNRGAVGSVMEVLADGVGSDGLLEARSGRQAPDIDGLTLVADATAEPGEFLKVRVTEADTYDLYAVLESGGQT